MAKKTQPEGFDTDALWEAVKAIARLVVLAIPGLAIGYFTNLPETQTTIIVLGVLRFIDKYVHESKHTDATGLVPF